MSKNKASPMVQTINQHSTTNSVLNSLATICKFYYFLDLNLLIIIWPWNKVELDLSMFIDSDLFLLLLGSWVLGLFYVRSHVKLMIYSACCKSVFRDSYWYYCQDLSFMPEIMFLCQFSSLYWLLYKFYLRLFIFFQWT